MSFDRKSPEYLVALDLEMNQPSGRIIQIGAAVAHAGTHQKVATFSQMVHLPYGEILNPMIVNLTGIRNQDLETGCSLEEAYQRLETWLSPFADRNLNPIVWGGGDSETLRAQLAKDNENWLFGRRWIDTKTLYTVWRWNQGMPGNGGLATAMKKMGLAFEGRKHNATDDAWNTLRMFFALQQQFKDVQN